MSIIDVDSLLKEVSANAPCGDDLEYDADFIAMEQAGTGKPEQQFGGTIIEAEEPDYREVKKLCLKLLKRTKDLRVVVHLARAIVRTDGMIGLGESLQLLHGLLDQYWETVHPQLDPDDDNDPTLRVNTLIILCDADNMIRAVRETPIVRSRLVGSFSYRDYLVATGELPPPPKKGDDAAAPPDLAQIEAAVTDCDLEWLKETAEAVRSAIETMQSSEKTLTAKVGVSHAVDLSALPNELKPINQLMTGWLARRGVREASPEPTAPENAESGAALTTVVNGSATASMSAGSVVMQNGEIRNRQDVVQTLDALCKYFETYEPSSPLPLLLERCRRLVSKTFLEILRDLAPDAVDQAERLRGVEGMGTAMMSAPLHEPRPMQPAPAPAPKAAEAKPVQKSASDW